MPKTIYKPEYQKKYRDDNHQHILKLKRDNYISKLTPEQKDRYFRKKAPKVKKKRLIVSKKPIETDTKILKQYGDDIHIKKQQIEMQIDQLLIERESNPFSIEIQSKINQLNCRL